MLKKARVMLLPEKVRVQTSMLWAPDSQDEALHKCRWLLNEDPAFGALPRLKCGPCGVRSMGFVQAGTPNGHGVVFFLVASFTVSPVKEDYSCPVARPAVDLRRGAQG